MSYYTVYQRIAKLNYIYVYAIISFISKNLFLAYVDINYYIKIFFNNI